MQVGQINRTVTLSATYITLQHRVNRKDFNSHKLFSENCHLILMHFSFHTVDGPSFSNLYVA